MGKVKQAGSGKIATLLNQGHFGSPDRELPESDPITPTQMIVEINRIKPYDHNPRRIRNHKYDEIKASIRAQRQVTSTLEITRRPGDDHYMVRAGGNTRLQILRELHKESGDDVFAQVRCVFRPWTGDAEVLTAHMVENELRGDLTFIDKALGLAGLRRQLEEESGGQLSRNAFLRKAADLGYSISKKLYILLEYCAEQLHPVIPIALDGGMGRPQVERIRKLEDACLELYARTQAMEPDDVRALVWDPLLQKLDGPDLDAAVVRHTLEQTLSAELEMDMRRVRLELDGLMHASRRIEDSSLDASEHEAFPLDSGPPPSAILAVDKPVDVPARAAEVTVGQPRLHSLCEDSESDTPTDGEHAPVAPEEPVESARTSPQAPISSPGDQPTTVRIEAADRPDSTPTEARKPETLPASVEPIEHPAEPQTSDIKSLRSRAYVLSLRIAQRHQLQSLVRPLPYQGLGWLTELPDHPFQKMDIRWIIWWVLLSFSEAAAFPDRASHLPEDHQLARLIRANDLDGVFALVGEPPPIADLPARLFNNPELSQQDFEDIFALAATCRRIRQEAGDDEQRIWSAS